MPACPPIITPASRVVLPAIPTWPAITQRSPISQLCAICTRLSIITKLPITVSPRLPRSIAELAPTHTPRPSRKMPICGIITGASPVISKPKPAAPSTTPACRLQPSSSSQWLSVQLSPMLQLSPICTPPPITLFAPTTLFAPITTPAPITAVGAITAPGSICEPACARVSASGEASSARHSPTARAKARRGLSTLSTAVAAVILGASSAVVMTTPAGPVPSSCAASPT